MTRTFWRRRGLAIGASLAALGFVLAAPEASALRSQQATPVSPRVLLVGTYKGIHGQYASIQAAVDAAHPGDWILVAPGDYRENDDSTHGVEWNTPGAVVITTSGIHIRGMDRNTVVVDGTKPGAPACSSEPADQNLGVNGSNGKPLGRNGVLVWKAANVSVQNLTACNFLNGAGEAGNAIWWDGDANSGKIGGHGFYGSYLTATSTFYDNETTAAAYGIFSSNWSGGTWDHTYASNFNDSGYYIGACQQVCDQTVNHAHAEYNALGYSGSNSGGQLVVENSEFDNNETGFSTNSQNGDNPPPQNGECPNGHISPITHTNSCWVFMNNYVHDNNNPNVPSAGSAAAGPVGTGVSVAGGRFDTFMHNRVVNNDAWGVIFVPYPDSGPPCTGGINVPTLCMYDDWGNALTGNTFSHNGSYGNPTNGDYAELTVTPAPSNCFAGNTEKGGGQASSSPPALQQLKPTCGGTTLPDPNPLFLAEVACDSQIALGPIGGNTGCLPGSHYPRRTQVEMHPLPSGLATMPDPCAGVPVNPWCP
jgi:hypothetical protein